MRCKKKKNTTKHNHILRPPQPNREQPYPPPATTNPTKTHHKINKNLPPQTNKTTTSQTNPAKIHHKINKKTHKKINKPHHQLTKRDPQSLGHHGEPHLAREREIDEDDDVLESTAMSPVKVGDPRKAASYAGVGHRGKRGRERERGHGGLCEERDEWGGRGGFVSEKGGGGWGVLFGKWFTKKHGCKPFSKNLQRIFWSTKMIFYLTTILQWNKYRKSWKHFLKNILQWNKRRKTIFPVVVVYTKDTFHVVKKWFLKKFTQDHLYKRLLLRNKRMICNFFLHKSRLYKR